MRICIHRGTQEIGGTCIELESQGKRLVLDIGMPLDVDDPATTPLPPVPGFEAVDESLAGVVISHPHADHYGLAPRLPDKTPFYIGAAAERILRAAAQFNPSGLLIEPTGHLEDRKPLQIGPFVVTPYLMDHSAYDSYAVLVEADGRRVFYTGDLRAHGRKASCFERLVKEPPPNVDLLLIEGTTVGREQPERFKTEAELEPRFVELFRQTEGMPLVWCSSQNIDRLVTIYKACVRAGRQLIIDVYTAEVLRATGNARIPQADWNGVRVYLPKSQKSQIIRTAKFETADRYRSRRIYPKQLAASASKSVMIFRPPMMAELEAETCITDSRLIYSLWSGYLRQERYRPLLDWLSRNSIPLDECHTSGHAAVADLLRVRAAFPGAAVVPVHTARPGDCQVLYGKAMGMGDGCWMDVVQNHAVPYLC